MLRSSKSFSAHSPPQDEKDYFQVTDELSQENAHLSMSEALLAVIEHYKATCLEQTLLQDQVPSSPQLNSSLPGNSSLFSRSPSTPGESASLSSWGSMSSVATLDGMSHVHVANMVLAHAVVCRFHGWAGLTFNDPSQLVAANAVTVM